MSGSFNFLQNKYTRWYFNIIAAAKLREIAEYNEKHHIIPKSLGGSNHTDNLVKLTAREHFICHRLLVKMVNHTKHRYQMWNAFSCMLYRKNKNQERHKINSKIFENIKKEGAKIKSVRMSGKNNPMFGVKGKDHPSYGKKWTEEHRKNASVAHQGQVRSAESRAKQSAKIKGRKQSPEHIAKRIKFGKMQSEESKEKIRQSILNMPLHVCEFCGLSTTKGNYKRWHGTNCKHKQGELKFLD